VDASFYYMKRSLVLLIGLGLLLIGAVGCEEGHEHEHGGYGGAYDGSYQGYGQGNYQGYPQGNWEHH
jgi:hypothetical protein